MDCSRANVRIVSVNTSTPDISTYSITTCGAVQYKRFLIIRWSFVRTVRTSWNNKNLLVELYKAAITRNEINESIATVKKRSCLFRWIGYTALKYFSEFKIMIMVIAIKLAKFLTAKSLKLGHRYFISIIYMLHFACRIFSVNNYSN